MHRAALAWMLAAASSTLAPTGGEPPSAAEAPATDSAREAFLAEAHVVRTRAAGGGGITGARRATLQLGEVQHDALIQSIDEWRSTADLPSGREFDFRDSYKNNVAAYRLDRLLGLGMVPVSVVRSFDHKPAGFTWWVDDVVMDEGARLRKKLEARDVTAWNRQMYVVRIFDQLIYNSDRNAGNLLIDGDWRIWMIDHTRAFKVLGEPGNPKNLGTPLRAQPARGAATPRRPDAGRGHDRAAERSAGQGSAGPPRLHRPLLRGPCP